MSTVSSSAINLDIVVGEISNLRLN